MSDQTTNQTRRQLMIGGAIGALAAAVPVLADDKKGKNVKSVKEEHPESFDALKSLFEAYNSAFSAQDIAAVLTLFAPNAVMLGTGPGEIWAGHEEISIAHQNFFQLFDKGKLEHETLYRDGNIKESMAWMTSMGKNKFTKGETVTEFGLNTSIVCEKTGGKWLVRALHFSNLTAASNS